MLLKSLTDTVPCLDITETPSPSRAFTIEGGGRRDAGSRLLETFEEQRRALAAEIHGELEQNLALARMHLAIGRESGLDAELAKSLQAIDKAVQFARRMVQNLRPSILDDFGLDAALGWHLDSISGGNGSTVRVCMTPQGARLPRHTAIVSYRILTEILSTFDEPSEIRIDLPGDNNELHLEILGNAETGLRGDRDVSPTALDLIEVSGGALDVIRGAAVKAIRITLPLAIARGP